jgi:O-antigen/teichoic acid export membrane protein
MSRAKFLGENIFFIGIGNITSRLIVFLLIPLYTEVLSTQAYGAVDLISSIIYLLAPVFSLSIFEGTVRFINSKKYTQTQVFTISLLICIGGCLLFLLLSPLFLLSNFTSNYYGWLVLLVITYIFDQLLAQAVRGMSYTKIYAIKGIIHTLCIVAFNILWLVIMQLGTKGYLASILTANCISILFLFFRVKLYRIIKLGKIDKTLLTDMLKFSFPLIPNSISWWLNQCANRFILAYFCGIAANGLFAVSMKIPTIMNIVAAIFIQAWQLSAIKEYDASDVKVFFSKIFNVYCAILIGMCCIIMILIKPIAQMAFNNDFFEAWKYVSALMISSLLGALQAYITTAFIAFKKTKVIFVSTLIAASFNIVLNIVLIPYMGIWGAVIANVLSYFVVFGINIYVFNKIIFKLDFNKIKLGLSFILLILMSIITVFGNQYSIFSIFLTVVILFMYRLNIIYLLQISRIQLNKIFRIIF